MEIIRKLAEMISEEIEDAEKYITCALNKKEESPALADTFYKLSLEEMNHMSMLHEQVMRIIDIYRRDKGDPPPAMMAVYEYLHGKHIEAAASVRAKQAMYK